MSALKEKVIELCQPVLDFCQNLGEPGLFTLSFIESSFFPIPPDFLYIPMVLGGAESPYRLALIASIGSVLGAVFGYFIGSFGGRPLAEKVLGEKGQKLIVAAEKFFLQYGPAAVLIAAFTPIPFKAFTISAGLCKMPLVPFTLYSALGRSGRFFIVVFLLVNFGEAMMKHFFELTLLGTVLLVFAYFVFRFLKKQK